MKAKSSIINDTLILLCITLIAGLILGIVYQVTRAPIDERKMAEKLEAYQKVYKSAQSVGVTDELTEKVKARQQVLAESGSEFGSVILNEILIAEDGSGEKIGYVASVTTKDGYAGEITLAVGVSLDSTVQGMEITDSKESAGLGSKAGDEPFKSQFSDKKIDKFTVVKTGKTNDSEIDAISGATKTSNAVVNAVNEAIASIKCIE